MKTQVRVLENMRLPRVTRCTNLINSITPRLGFRTHNDAGVQVRKE